MDRAVADRTPAAPSAALPPDGNAVDLHYVESAYATLHAALAASRSVATRGSSHEVRALAREALAQQTAELVAITGCLRAWDRPEALGPHPDATTLRGLEGTDLDQAFTEALKAHAEASKTAARVELDGGECRRVRDIAQNSIRTHGLMQAAVTRLARATARR